MWGWRNNFPFYSLPFYTIVVSIALQKLFSFSRSQLLIMDFSACNFGVLFRKLSNIPMRSRIYLAFSSIRFSMSGLIFRCDPSQFDLCSWWWIWLYLQSSTCRYPVKADPFVEDVLFFPLYVPGFFIKKNQRFIYVWIFVLFFASIQLLCLFLYW